MKKEMMKIVDRLLIFMVVIFVLGMVSPGSAQLIKWLRVSDLQGQINDIGCEYEGEFALGGSTGNFLAWPAQYSIDQTTHRSKLMFIGCKNFDDPVEGKIKSYKVIGVNSRDHADRPNQVFEGELKMIGKYPAPFVIVDNQNASAIGEFDLVDEYDPSLVCDRMVVVNINTSIGISGIKKVMVFANSAHGNYFINDWVFKNTGIYNRAGAVKEQTLQDVYIYFGPRPALSGVSCLAYGQGWGSWESTWGDNVVQHSFGEDPTAAEFTDPASRFYQLRGYFWWYHPSQKRTAVSYDEDWGCPDQGRDGTLSSARYPGWVTLHADKSTSDQSDDLYQPHTTWYYSADHNIFQANTTQYDEIYMGARYAAMSEGKPTPDQQHYVRVDDNYPQLYTDPLRQGGGGIQAGEGFGPYTMAPGDSIHIVFAEGVAGMSWDKASEIGRKWLEWKNGTSTPELRMPDGSIAPNNNEYKRAWCVTGEDSILKTLNNAKLNYESGYNLPEAPPPPNSFTVQSGGDRIILSWAENATSTPNFDGYVIYRSRGNVLQYTTVYEKIFECNAANVVHTFNDVTAVRGFDYYYYIQSKVTRAGEGTTYSSLFWTITSLPATLQRPATPPTPYPPAQDAMFFKPATYKGAWSADTLYNIYSIVTYNDKNYVAWDSVGISSALPDTSTDVWKPTRDRGAWAAGSGYKAYDVMTYESNTFVCLFDISSGKGLELVRVVPNPYDIRSRIFQYGDESQYDRISFFNLPPICKLKIFTERGDLIWQRDHTTSTGDETWDSLTSSGQIVASGIYILYVEAPGQGSVFRKFVIIR